MTTPELCVGPFESNPDISGIGIRISFYIQVVCLSCLSVRASSAVEAGNALSTLVVTNLAYAVATLVLGNLSPPSMSLLDALVVFYLLTLSWLTVFIGLPHYTRFKRSDSSIKFLAVVQSYVCFVTGFVILTRAPTFGSDKECNSSVRAALFGPFKLLDGGRIAYLVILSVITAAYTVMLIFDHNHKEGKPIRLPWYLPNMSLKHGNLEDGDEEAGQVSNGQSQPNPPSSNVEKRRSRRRPPKPVDGTVLVQLLVLAFIIAIGIANTELLMRYNRSAHDGPDWTFGQILPLFLTILPIWTTFRAFKTHKLREKQRKKQRRKQGSKRERSGSGRQATN